MQSQLAVQATNIYKAYGAIRALEDVSLEVSPGQIFGLIGANGAGKSTFIKLLVGATKADRGQLKVLGFDPRRQKGALRKEIGYMPQTPALYEDLTAAENLRYFAQAHGLENLKTQIKKTLDFVELSQRHNDPVNTLSGGMKQRVSLACALVHQPRLLLLDEPTAGVDLKLRSAFWEHFKQLTAAGTTILVSTHQMDEVVHCHELAIINEGRILTTDTPQKLLQRGQAEVRLWRGDQIEKQILPEYPLDLPKALRAYGLDPHIERIELAADSLESIVLNLIDKNRTNPGGPN